MKQIILLYGEQILLNKKLLKVLKKIAVVLTVQCAENIHEILNNKSIDLLVFESGKNWKHDLKLLQDFRKNYPDLIIIIINGGDSPDNVIRSFKIGVDDYFKKPLDAILLIERIEALLKSKF